MSYSSWSVIPGEQPTTAKWNILGTNEADFNARLETLEATPTWIGVSSFSNGWVNYGAGYYDASYVKDAAGYVHLRGAIKSGSGGTVAFSLPAGYRPSSAVAFPALSSTGNIGASTALGAVQINSNGDVTITGPSLLTGFVSLAEVVFYPG